MKIKNIEKVRKYRIWIKKEAELEEMKKIKK